MRAGWIVWGLGGLMAGGPAAGQSLADLRLIAFQPVAPVAARVVMPGDPRPSITVGTVEPVLVGQPLPETPEETLVPRTPGADVVAGTTFIGYEDAPDVTGRAAERAAERARLRAVDPERYAAWVEQGLFDPPEELLAHALQAELERMGCYRNGVDGDWGRRSQASVSSYFDQREGVESLGTEATISLFRVIVRSEDVACPAPPQQVARADDTDSRPEANADRPRTERPVRPQQPLQETVQQDTTAQQADTPRGLTLVPFGG